MNSRIKRVLAASMAVLILVCMLPELAGAAPRATRVNVVQSSITIDLGKDVNHTIEATVLPEGASQRKVYASKSKAIATVNSKGLITAKKTGTTQIGVRPAGVKRWTNIKVKVVDSLKPTSVSIPQSKVALEPGASYELLPTFLPSTASQEASYSSTKTSVATVTSQGVITGRSPGVAYVRVRSKRAASVSRAFKVTVTKGIRPSSISISPDDKVMTIGQVLPLKATILPENASQSVTWKSGNAKLATVNSNGEVTALKEGTVKITAIAKARSTIKTVRTIKITDPHKPTKIYYTSDDTVYFPKKSTYQLEWAVEPASARKDATFKSSNTSIVSVDAGGKLTMKDDGIVTITVQAVGTTLKDTIKVVSLESERTVNLPDRYTNAESDIAPNLAKIDAIKSSAMGELLAAEGAGRVSGSVSKLRRESIASAFVSFGFAWKSDENVAYWDSSLKQNNFVKNRIYFGMPYIQKGSGNDYSNRQFNLPKAVSQGYFRSINNSSRYYEMTGKRLNNFYVGCDCSSFVSLATWGTSHPAAYLNTTAMAKSSYYRTVTGPTNMIPGDLMVRSGRHTIMFLYYVDKGKTQMMLIENAGGTVSCKVANVSTYLGQGYVIKRPAKY